MIPIVGVDPYPEIGDYAVIGDCRTAALISRKGSIDWLCMPDFDSPSVFAAILDDQAGGRFAVFSDPDARYERRYVTETAVLETTVTSTGGSFRLTDLMAVDPAVGRKLRPQREVLRIIEVLNGAPTIRILYQPRPDYARKRPRIHRRGVGVWLTGDNRNVLLLHTDIPLALDGEHASLSAEFQLHANERRFLSLTCTGGSMAVIPGLDGEAEVRLVETLCWWQEWSSRCRYKGPYAGSVLRSALTLKLLTFCLSGAVVAAPTSSLPEWIGGPRNWDYRYCWLRDAALTLRAFLELGFTDEGHAFLNWMINSTRLTASKLQVMYSVYGLPTLDEQHLDHLEGYRRSTPVRIGNGAHSQLQLDIYGSVIVAAYDYLQGGGRLSRQEKQLLIKFGKTVCRQWRKPDNGIWEYPHGRRHNTFSKMMCWAALDRLTRLHDEGSIKVPKVRFEEHREAIRREIELHGVDPSSGSYVSVFGGEELDATLLLFSRYHYAQANAPRMNTTFERMDRELGQGALLYRYHRGFDGMDAPEGAFGAASFWAVEFLALQGAVLEARQRFEELLGYANDVGLYGEEIEPKTGRALGNFPQAFTHAALINAALSISAAERSAK